MEKLVILGMNRPQQDGQEALSLLPVNGTGDRLWRLAAHRTGIPPEEWLDITERHNLVEGPWSLERAKLEARSRYQTYLQDRTVVMLGLDVWGCMRPRDVVERLTNSCEWLRSRDWAEIPHPSGLNRWYNNPLCYEAVAIFLGELVEHFSEGRWPLLDTPADLRLLRQDPEQETDLLNKAGVLSVQYEGRDSTGTATHLELGDGEVSICDGPPGPGDGYMEDDAQ